MPRNGVVELEWRNVSVTIIRATHTSEDGFDIVIDSITPRKFARLSSTPVRNLSLTTLSKSCESKPASRALAQTWTTQISSLKRILTMR